ncbi:MAG: TonB-dependent receptor [Prevotella sp.]|nr:TonB-dependent receptor [Prevotella sp.]
MKLSVFLFFVSVFSLYAGDNYSQQLLPPMEMKNATLKQIFSEIEKKSDYVFLVTEDANPELTRKTSFKSGSKAVSEVMDVILSGTELAYKVAGRQIAVYRNSEEKIPSITPAVVQQKKTITGVVIDAVTGQPVIGASVWIKDSTTGIFTDADGKFSIQAGESIKVLVCSFLGYIAQEIPIGNKTVINIQLRESVDTSLDEVVVVAYGTQRKSTVSGSLSTVKSDKIIATAPTISAMLQGQVAGMNVSQSSGKPGEGGNIVIRGIGSISAETSPVWVVDGIVGGTTSSLNPNDIESVTVLKDGSATALYGSRGANGAIVVITKKARTGENKIDATVKLGITNLTRGNFKMMNSGELYEYTDMMFKNTGIDPYPWFTPALMDNDTDWFDIATQTGFTSNYNVAYRTGSEKIRSYTALDYYKEEGAVQGYDYERYTLRNNMAYKFNDKLNINASFAGNYSNTSDRQRSLYSAGTYLPWDTPTNSLDETKTGKEGQDINTGKPMSDYWFGRDASNYLYDNQMNWGTDNGFGVDISLGFDYTITDGLVFESKNNFGYSNTSSRSYVDPKSQSGASDGGTIYNGNNYTRNRYTNQLLRYSKIFNRLHDISAFLGHEYSDQWYRTNSLTGKGIPQGGKVPGVASEPKSINGDEYYNNKSEGYYFNTNYTYDNRYFGQVSFRRDGSSKFGRDNRYGNFWTIGGGWNLHSESFLKNSIDIINQLRLRASYGVTGNTPGGTFYSLYLYDLNREYDKKPGAFPKQMGNPEMSWETAKSTNVGLDMRFFDRLACSTDFYIKNVSGLLYSKVLSTLSGYSNVWLNEGRLQNTGIEVSISPEIIKSKDWNWTLDFNFAYNKNEIKSLADGKQTEISGNQIREVGYPIGTYYMREWGGVDIMTGNPTWVKQDEEGNRSWVINQADANSKNLDKTRYPDFTGGMQTRLVYKDFVLSASFSFATGFYIYHSGREVYDNDGAEPQYNSMKLKNGWSRWEKPGDQATHPRPMIGGNAAAQRESSRFLERGDFFKMKTLGISYNVPKRILGTFGLKSAQVGLSADNLFTITEFSGIDTEVAVSGSSYSATSYPLPRKYMFNLSLGF